MNKEKDFNDKLRGQNDTLMAEKEQLKDEIEVRLNKIRNLNAEIESKVGYLENQTPVEIFTNVLYANLFYIMKSLWWDLPRIFFSQSLITSWLQ